MNLKRRVEGLEARCAVDPIADLDLRNYDSFGELGERIAMLARRYAAAPAMPRENQAQVERIIRAALGAADGASGAEYARIFWRSVAASLRRYEAGRAA